MIGAMLPLGIFELSHIAQAHNSVNELGSVAGDQYNYISNNCGDHIVEFFEFMGDELRVTPTLLEFVAEHLENHSASELTSGILGHLDDHALNVDESMTDFEIIYSLLEYRCQAAGIMDA